LERESPIQKFTWRARSHESRQPPERGFLGALEVVKRPRKKRNPDDRAALPKGKSEIGQKKKALCKKEGGYWTALSSKRLGKSCAKRKSFVPEEKTLAKVCGDQRLQVQRRRCERTPAGSITGDKFLGGIRRVGQKGQCDHQRRSQKTSKEREFG